MLSGPFLSIHDIHERVTVGASSAASLINQAHAHLDQHQPQLQAFRSIGKPPSVAPEGLLAGISVSVKDLYSVFGRLSLELVITL